MKTLFRLALFGLMLAAVIARASNDSIVTAVSSKVANGYHRATLPNGSFKREYYALTNGIYVPGVSRDRSIDAVRFPQVAKIVAQFLALRNYYLADNTNAPEILLRISWGTTVPLSDSTYRNQTDRFLSASNNLAAANTGANGASGTTDGIQSAAASVADAARSEFEGQLIQMQMFEDMRMTANEHNARLLGYMDEINYRNNPSRFAGAGMAYDDLISDIESERYYVIIAAYDFRAAKEEAKEKLLWVTRVSVQAQGNKFNETLAAMLARASRYFGQDSGRLVRQYQREGTVTLGELKVLGVAARPDFESDASEEKAKNPQPSK